MKRVILTLTCLSVPALVHAQVPVVQPPITAVRFVISGGVSPVTNDIPVTSLVSQTGTACAPVTASVTNPTSFVYKILATDTTCWKYQDPGSGPLLSLPIGATVYTSTVAYVNSNGAGPVSPISNPFSRPGVLPSTAPAVLSLAP
jgi:hypothetical protein